MTGLVRIEARRYRSRRAIRWLVLAAVLAGLTVVVSAWTTTRPASEPQIADARAMYEMSAESWADDGDQMVEDCLAGQAEARETTPDADWGCDDMAPRLEHFLPYRSTFADSAAGWTSGAVLIVLMLVFAAGTTFVTAEIGSGALGTWLTFVPRRGRVYASKVAVAAGGALVPMVLALAVALGGAWGVATLHDAVGTVTSSVAADLGWQVLRALAAAVVLGAVGAALGVLTRTAAGALGLAVGWVLLVDVVLTGFLPAITPWTLLAGLQAWLRGSTSYYVTVPCEPLDGVAQQGICSAERVVTGLHGGLLVLGVAVVLVAVAAVVFRRRDVD